MAVGCAAGDDDDHDPVSCTYEELGSVAIDVPVDGFTAEQIIALATTETTGDATGVGLTETYPAVLDHRFSTLGDATEIAYQPSDDPTCPTGSALSIPVSYVVDGAIGDWWVQGPRLWLTLIASAPTLDAVWTGTLPGGTENRWGGAADSGLEDLARTTLGLPVDCVLGFDVGPSAQELFPDPGAPDDGIQGHLNVACEATEDEFLTWTAERVVEEP